MCVWCVAGKGGGAILRVFKERLCEREEYSKKEGETKSEKKKERERQGEIGRGEKKKCARVGVR